MRATSTKTGYGFEAKAISGIHIVLIALNCPDASRKGLKGYGSSESDRRTARAKFLRSQKVFKSVVPTRRTRTIRTARRNPRRSTPTNSCAELWATAAPGTNIASASCRCPRQGAHDRPEGRVRLEFRPEGMGAGETHGVWFNRGAIVGQKLPRFGKAAAGHQQSGRPTVKWLSGRPA